MRGFNAGRNAQYSSYHIIAEMQESLSFCLEEATDKYVQESQFIGLLIDESTDIGTLIVYIRLCDKGQVLTHFIKSMGN